MFSFRLLYGYGGLLVIAVFLIGGMVGCDNSIDPYSGDGSYSIYGYLSSGRSQQFVRVKPLHQPLSGDDTSSLDVTVTLENLDEGTMRTLQDSVIRFEDEGATIATHNFWTDMPVTPETRYRLAVEPPDKEIVHATATTPSITEPELFPQSGTCLTEFTVEFPDIEDSRFVRATVVMRLENRTLQFSSPYDFEIHDERPDSVYFSIQPDKLLNDVVDSIDDPETECQYEHRCLKLTTDQVAVRFTYLGPDWYGDIPDTLEAAPLESIHVENGRGFFGAAYQDEKNLIVNNSDPIPIANRACP